MREDLSDLFKELDADIRELLSVVKMMKIDLIVDNVDDEAAITRLQRALFLTQRIQAELYSVSLRYMEVKR
ncbi:hypothetical protein LS215_2040 [Sulfolobus islandicus L.S.2.15]|uniref:Uncharacterized protein n=2 Tax=Saccharolobus islandicus TaxID=43080 RepID=C3MRM1_SACI2|nr:hypothetical protein LS215_2040 [Sulfolobus islandicus L.S.2.15]